MLGFMSKQEALSLGYTNHGKYFGLPVYLADDGPGLMVTAKCKWLNWAVDVIATVEGILRDTFRPQDPPGFQFWVGPRIAP